MAKAALPGDGIIVVTSSPQLQARHAGRIIDEDFARCPLPSQWQAEEGELAETLQVLQPFKAKCMSVATSEIPEMVEVLQVHHIGWRYCWARTRT